MTDNKMESQRKKLSRNIIICKLRDKDNLSLKELVNMFGTSESNISHTIDRHWHEYIKYKNGDLTDLMTPEYNKK